MGSVARFGAFAAVVFCAAHAYAADGLASPTRTLDVNAFAFEVKEPRIVVGDTASTEIVLTAKTTDGAALDVAPPRLTVSSGSLSAPVRTAPGTWTTVFVPPKEAFPHVVIVFATIETATTSAVGFLPLHLWGKGQTTVHTKPRSQVTVFIGNESFGPVVADADGAARVDIVVPPGPERAVARSVDELGNESQKTIDLGVPPFNRLTMVALDAVAAADGTGEARLLVFAVDKKGDPLYQAKLTSTASVGDVDKEPVGLSPGMFRLGYRPGKAPRGKATVTVSLDSVSRAQVDIELLSGRPVKAALDSAVSTLSADDPREVIVVLRLFDEANNAVPAQAASVDVDYGRIDAIGDAAGGARKVTWIIPSQTSRAKATLTVRTPTGDVLGHRELTLLAGKPAKLTFDAVDPVVADGRSAVDVHLRVVDAAGNPLVPTGAALAIDPQWGQLVAATVDGTLYRARFVAAANDHADFARITGTLGGLTATTDVKIVPRPRSRLLVGVGATAGSNYGSLIQAGPDVSLLVRLPGFDGSAHAGLSVSVLQAVRAPAGVDHRSFPLSLEGAWRPLLSPDLALHVGAAAGFVLSDEVKSNTRFVQPGAFAQAVVGAGYRVGPGFVELDVRAGYGVTFAVTDVGLPLGAGVVLGYRFGI